MEPVIGLLIVISLTIVNGTNIVDNTIRKWLGKEKVLPREERFPKYALGIFLLLLIAFLASIQLIGIESSNLYILIFFLIAAFSGVEAILERIHVRDSVDYKLTFYIGLLKAVFNVVLMFIYIQVLSSN